MGYIVSLQGGMASGKTTLLNRLHAARPELTISYENPAPIIQEVKARGLNKLQRDDFLDIQRLFIEAEIQRYKDLCDYQRVVMELGPEEIEFYTLFFPQSINQDWDIPRLLKKELTELRKCSLSGILFLDASPQILRQHKEQDTTRARNFFDHYLTGLHPAKREWFANKAATTFLKVDNLTPDQVFAKACAWLDNLG